MKIVNASVVVVLICAMQAGLAAGAQPLQHAKTARAVDPAQASTSQKTSAQSSKRKWAPAVYRGLVVGKSSKADALKVLGKPDWIGKESETLTPMMNFTVSEPVAGTLSVLFDRDVVSEMSLSPKEHYTKSSIVKVFGPDYVIVHYSADDCLAEGGTAPMYENPNGDIESLEYRPRGIAIGLRYDDVEEISFVKGPLAPMHSKCPKTKKTTPTVMSK